MTTEHQACPACDGAGNVKGVNCVPCGSTGRALLSSKLVTNARREAGHAEARGHDYGHPYMLVTFIRQLCNEIDLLRARAEITNETFEKWWVSNPEPWNDAKSLAQLAWNAALTADETFDESAAKTVLRECDEYLSRNNLNYIGSGSILHRSIKTALGDTEKTEGNQ